jgi:hypothetical protein
LRFFACLITVFACAPLQADLAQVRAEPNLEKRSRAALDNAERALKDSRKAYDAGDLKQTEALLDEVKESVNLAEASLEEKGKNPIKSPKHFKNAEIKTSELVRRLDAFSQSMNAADRPLADQVKERVQEAHERLLHDIMIGKKKK